MKSAHCRSHRQSARCNWVLYLCQLPTALPIEETTIYRNMLPLFPSHVYWPVQQVQTRALRRVVGICTAVFYLRASSLPSQSLAQVWGFKPIFYIINNDKTRKKTPWRWRWGSGVYAAGYKPIRCFHLAELRDLGCFRLVSLHRTTRMIRYKAVAS